MQLTLVILIALIPSITTLSCYVCNSNADPACSNDGNLGDFVTECNKTLVEPHCRKMVQTVEKVVSVVRSCGSKIGAKSCYKTAGTNSANVCSCNADRCNNARNFNRQEQMITIISSTIVMALTMIVLR